MQRRKPLLPGGGKIRTAGPACQVKNQRTRPEMQQPPGREHWGRDGVHHRVKSGQSFLQPVQWQTGGAVCQGQRPLCRRAGRHRCV